MLIGCPLLRAGRHVQTSRDDDDEERLGGRQNSLSRAQLIIKAAAGTVKLSRSAIRELRVRVVRRRRRFQGPRFRIRHVRFCSDSGARERENRGACKRRRDGRNRRTAEPKTRQQNPERRRRGERDGKRPMKSRPGTTLVVRLEPNLFAD